MSEFNNINFSELKILDANDLAPILRRKASTIKVDARRRPETLPPRLKIQGSAKLIWLEKDVLNWINNCRTNT